MDQGVEEAEGPAEAKPLGADLEDQEGPIAGRLDVHRDELRLVERSIGADRRVVVLAFRRLPSDQLGGAARLEPERAFG